MNIKSYTFFFFTALSLILYYIVPKKRQWIFLFLANTVFYAICGVQNFIFILLTAATTFFAASIVCKYNSALKQKKGELSKEEFKLEKEKTQKKKRAVLVFVLLIIFGILAWLKYWGTIAPFFGISSSKSLFLPLGISFYTFQTFSYFMDVYNSKYDHEKSFLRYFMFVSFFPQLMMGPINRYDFMAPQFSREHEFKFENVKRGVLLILFGTMKKYCIADMLVNRISSLLDHPYTNLPGCLILLGVLSYSIYQYADFSGGIDIMFGIAKLFDLEMQPNFRQPYFSTSLADFWRRWHITLGAWMRDYVFYPFVLLKPIQNFSKWANTHIGKHFARTFPAGMANIIVFLLVGIWHGPEMHFVIWGLFNGIVIAFSDMLKPVYEKINSMLRINTKSKVWHVFQIVRTFIVVNIGAYFDRIVDVPKSFLYLKRTFTNFGNFSQITNKHYLKSIFGSFRTVESELVLIFVASIIVFVISVLKENKIDVYDSIQKKNIAFRWTAYYIPLILVILSLSFAPGNPVFMYAQY